ncbi:sugar ABC transporter permease [Carboxydochorda subterranea]|uniref:Sugar ABC transporter permease n=1 Tax=Carboxydichorda subterranea TaxID=3109565 RepID=A0ABZ1BXQ3_9FIRM|nr:sugar ABC transporter permease [Limnochorda sp. L945t]WRP17590.1 sugar ABC transporter permease [Limnochorda sp. L945t]
MRSQLRTTLIAYAFLLPALVLMGVYTFWPMAFGTYLGFARYNVITPPQWVGLDNFRELAGETDFWTGLSNSLRYVLVVPIIQLAAIGAAVLVNRRLPGIALFRAAYYVPVVTSFAVVGIMWGWMYDQYGPVNWVLRGLGLLDRPVNFLNRPAVALYAVMFVTLWKGFGYYMVLYLAGLQSIDRTYEEAALIDGAGRWTVFWRITLPLLRPVILLCSLLSTISAIKVFEEIFVMTGGGPAGSTYTAMYYIYSKAFQDFRYGEAAAASLVLAVVSLLFSLLNFRYVRGGQVA